MLPLQTTAWVLTDGKAGDEVQCQGVIEALGLTPEIRRIAPRAPWTWAMPRGPIDPREAPGKPGSPIRPPFPDLVVASGRRAAAYLRHIRKASGGRSFTVFLKDARIGSRFADLVWVPEHDRLRGDNVLVTLTSPHRLSREKIAAARAQSFAPAQNKPVPRVAVLVGGDSRHYRFKPEDIAQFAQALDRLAASGAFLMGSRSRRTQAALDQAVGDTFARHGGWYWDGTGENPYIALLAHADAIVVTADSVNMVGEAAATGKPVLVFDPSGGHRKIAGFLEKLRTQGVVHKFVGALEGGPYAPLDATQEIAAAIAQAMTARRSA